MTRHAPASPSTRPGVAGRRRITADAPLLAGTLLLTMAVLGGCVARPRPAAIGAASGSGTGVSSAASIAAASADPSDPVAMRLAVYLRLLLPNGGTATEIADFLRRNPSWPNHALLNQRLDQALANETDAGVLGELCASTTLLSSSSLLRCAGLSAHGPDAGPMLSGPAPVQSLPDVLPPAIVAAARSAWIGGIDRPDQAAAFLDVWGRILTPADQWRRFDRLEWSGNDAAAQRMVLLLAASEQPLATARLSLRRNAPGADGIAAALQGAAARDPVLVLDLARWLRRNDRTGEALALWRGTGFAAEIAIPPARLAAFWTERDALARDLLRDHHDADAFALADDTVQTDPTLRIDSAFLTGWIALRRLHDPADAARRFAQLLGAQAAITRSRGGYWVGRALLASGDRAGGEAALASAAAFPTTFYGQLAAARLQAPSPGPATLLDPSLGVAVMSSRLGGLRDPTWTSAAAIRFAGLDLARAAELLVSWNDPRHARAFLLKLDETSTSDVDHALAASLAERLGLPDVAVAIARAAGRKGVVLPQTGWPRPFAPPDLAGGGTSLPSGLALAVMRQESSFDPQIVSPAGARGLMQLTTGTARDTARTIGRPQLASGSGMSLFDPDVNQTLGSAYLGGLLTRFGGVVPYAVAAYNAGPHRVDRWLVENGDPAHAPASGPTILGDDDAQARMVDWIETIPFAETRNYVERVMENLSMYQNRVGDRT